MNSRLAVLIDALSYAFLGHLGCPSRGKLIMEEVVRRTERLNTSLINDLLTTSRRVTETIGIPLNTEFSTKAPRAMMNL